MATGDERPSRLVATAERLAFFPARVAARASRDRLAATPDDVLVAELAASGALDRAVKDALASDQMRLAIKEVVESPEMRAALTRQTTGLAEELVGSVRARAAQLDDRVERRDRPAPVPFAGAVSRAAAFGIDLSIVFLAFVSLSALVALVSTLVGTLRPEWLVGLLLASGFLLLAGIYFVTFWSGAGQTPGMRLLRLRLLGSGGRPPSFWRAIVRGVGTVLAIVPFFAGYLPVLFDDRRRGLPDLLAGTVVVYEEASPPDGLSGDRDR